MIGQGRVRLYEKQENYICLSIRLSKNMKIYTQWFVRKSQKIARSALKNLKINGCAICGYNKCDRALEFHHVNPQDKKFQVQALTMYRKDFADELNKCILLCANCHREMEEKEWKEK